MQWGQPGVLIGGGLFVAFILMLWGSVWLKGRGWFIATVVTLGAALLFLAMSGAGTASEIERYLVFGGVALVYGAFCYLIAGRYLTETSVTDITFQSHDALVKFLDESGDTSVLARIMRKAGLWLFVAMFVYGGFVAWAKFAGAVE